MVVNMENQSPKIEAVLLGAAALLFALGLAAQFVFVAQPILFRIVGLLVAAGFSMVLIANTKFGHRAWAYWQDSIIELRKVVWPTKQETIHSTIAVLAMVFVMGLVLWSIDAVLVRLVAWIVRQGAV
jgi:preprotein translocase subunit SecE